MADPRITEPISDLQMLYDYSMSAATAATAYIALATRSREAKVRRVCMDLGVHAAESAFEANELIAKLGGEM